jgi:hypothetical protein
MMLINLYGDGIYYNVIELSDVQMQKLNLISSKSAISVEELLFDLSVLEILGIDSFDDFNSIAAIGGIHFSKKTKFEFRTKRKLLHKISLDQLNNDGLLFPLYQIDELKFDLSSFSDNSKNRFVLVEIIRGHLGKFVFEQEVKLDDITFEFTTIHKNETSERLLTNVLYQESRITNKLKDAVIIRQFAEKL